MTVQDIPTLNACCNGIATVLIASGLVAVKRAQRETDAARRARLVQTHRRLMGAALAASAVFLAGYLTYHGMRRGMHTLFGGEGLIRTLYLLILWTHIPLAALIAFLVPRTVLLALRGEIERHRRWAAWTYPVWLYVSVTGVLVYLFLYVWWPSVR